MRKPQAGYLFEGAEGKSFHVRYYLYSAKGKRIQKSHKLVAKNVDHPSVDATSVIALCEDFMRGVNEAVASERSGRGHRCAFCGERCRRTVEGKFKKIAGE